MKMARREAPSRLRVPPAQGLCLSKTGPPRRWLSSSRSVIRAGFGRQPPLWKERRKAVEFSTAFYGVRCPLKTPALSVILSRSPNGLNICEPELTTLLG